MSIDAVAPRTDQPRQTVDAEALEDLARSVAARGVLQPIRVRCKDDGYELVAGQRRLAACRHAGIREIPAMVVEIDDNEAYVEALVENLQREDLNLADRARALTRLRTALGASSWEEVGRAIGISRRHVYHLLDIIRLPTAIQEDIRVGALTEKHGRALWQLRDHPEQQARLWARICSEHLCGDAALKIARSVRRGTGAAPSRAGRRVAEHEAQVLIERLLSFLVTAAPPAIQSVRADLNDLQRWLTEVLSGSTEKRPLARGIDR